MCEKILVASGKGGVGKSTVTVFLGRTAASKGKRVLLIDSDTGMGALDIMLRVSDKVMNTWADVTENRCEAEDAIIQVSDNLFLMPSPKIYPDNIPENVFLEILNECHKKFDIIFIDASAGIDNNLKRCAIACEKALFVVTADEVSVRCASSAADKCSEFGMERSNMRLVVNRYVRKAAEKNRLLNIDGAIDRSGVMLLGVIPEDKKIPFSSVTGVFPDAKSRFMKAVCRVYDRMNGKNVPLALKKI